jgi:hypothetical protein
MAPAADDSPGASGGTGGDDGGGEWYWCLRHKAAEPADTDCPPGERLGPYPTKDAAVHWKEGFDRRNQAWDAEEDW